MLLLLHRKGTRASQYFARMALRACSHCSCGRIFARAGNSAPVAFPRTVAGAILTSELFRIRLYLPESLLVITYNLPASSANHTGVVTATPFLRNVVRLM